MKKSIFALAAAMLAFTPSSRAEANAAISMPPDSQLNEAYDGLRERITVSVPAVRSAPRMISAAMAPDADGDIGKMIVRVGIGSNTTQNGTNMQKAVETMFTALTDFCKLHCGNLGPKDVGEVLLASSGTWRSEPQERAWPVLKDIEYPCAIIAEIPIPWSRFSMDDVQQYILPALSDTNKPLVALAWIVAKRGKAQTANKNPQIADSFKQTKQEFVVAVGNFLGAMAKDPENGFYVQKSAMALPIPWADFSPADMNQYIQPNTLPAFQNNIFKKWLEAVSPSKK